MLARLKPARGKAVRSDLLSVLAERAGTAMKRHLVALPWLCLQCVHCQIDASVPAPRAIRALSDGRALCTLELPLPVGPLPCGGFCPAGKTGSDKEAHKALTARAFCGLMGAPENLARRHKSLFGFPRAGQILVCMLSFCCSAPASFLARCLHILGRLQRPGDREAPAASLRPGSVVTCPFSFPKLSEVSHV